MSLIVVNIPGAQLMSTKGAGANCTDHRMVKAREKARHREGANGNVARVLGYLPGYESRLWFRKKKPSPVWTVRGLSALRCGSAHVRFPVARVLFTRICPRRYFCDPGGNLATMFKPLEDGTADTLGVDDKLFVPTHPSMPVQSGNIGVWYEQIDGPWGVRITIVPA